MKSIVEQIVKVIGNDYMGQPAHFEIVPNKTKATIWHQNGIIILEDVTNDKAIGITMTNKKKQVIRKDMVNRKLAVEWVNRDGEMFNSLLF